MKSHGIAIRLALMVAGMSIGAVAQVQLGDVSLTGNESLSAGYSGEFGDAASSHGLGWGSQTTLNGSYYAPQFLNFSVVPYFNQSRANSDSLSVSNASGVSANVNLFSGSPAPVTVAYTKAINSSSSYNFGQSSFASHGDASSISVGSSLHMQGLPSLMLLYQQGETNSELYGSAEPVTTKFHTVIANSGYRWDGFQFQGGYQTHWGDSTIPNPFTDSITTGNSNSTSYSASVSHTLPFRGDVSFGYEHEKFTDTSNLGSAGGAINFLNSTLSFHPSDGLLLQSNMNYNDNLVGVLQQSIDTANGVVIIASDGQKSDSLLLSNMLTYTGIRDVGLSGGYVYAQQQFQGIVYSSQSFNANANYTRNHVLGGRWTSSMNVTEDLRGNNQFGYRLMSGWSRHFGVWNVNGNYSFEHATRAQLISYTSSGYSFAGNVGRRFRKFYWNLSAAEFKSKFDQISSFQSTSRSYSSNLSAKYGSFGGTYTKSSGNSFLTSTGLSSTNLPTPVIGPTVFFDGNSYSLSGAVYPRRGFEITGSYAKAKSSTALDSASSWNSSSQANLRLTYLFRKVSFTAGYANLHQDFTLSPTGASSFSTYFFGLQRWFNLL